MKASILIYSSTKYINTGAAFVYIRYTLYPSRHINEEGRKVRVTFKIASFFYIIILRYPLYHFNLNKTFLRLITLRVCLTFIFHSRKFSFHLFVTVNFFFYRSLVPTYNFNNSYYCKHSYAYATPNTRAFAPVFHILE